MSTTASAGQKLSPKPTMMAPSITYVKITLAPNQIQKRSNGLLRRAASGMWSIPCVSTSKARLPVSAPVVEAPLAVVSILPRTP